MKNSTASFFDGDCIGCADIAEKENTRNKKDSFFISCIYFFEDVYLTRSNLEFRHALLFSAFY